MDKRDALKVMKVLKIAFPTFYRDYTADELGDTAAMWASMLGDYSYADVAKAVQATIAVNKFPPTIAEVIEKIHSLHGQGMSEMEAWGYISKAVRSSTYRSREEWERLPAELQKIVSPDMLRNWAMTEAEDVETVIQSNFIKTFRTTQARQKEYDRLPSAVKEYMAQIGGGADGLLGLPGQGHRTLERKEE